MTSIVPDAPSRRDVIGVGDKEPAYRPATKTNTLYRLGRHIPSAPAIPPTTSTSFRMRRSPPGRNGIHPAAATARSFALDPDFVNRHRRTTVSSGSSNRGARGTACPGLFQFVSGRSSQLASALPVVVAGDVPAGDGSAGFVAGAGVPAGVASARVAGAGGAAGVARCVGAGAGGGALGLFPATLSHSGTVAVTTLMTRPSSRPRRTH